MKQKTTSLIAILFIAIVIVNSGCATILTGSSQKVTFKTNVDRKSTVVQNLKPIGNANEPIEIKRYDLEKLYTIQTEGCNDAKVELPVTINPAYWVNIPFYFVGLGILTASWDLNYRNHLKTESVIMVNIDCPNAATTPHTTPANK